MGWARVSILGGDVRLSAPEAGVVSRLWTLQGRLVTVFQGTVRGEVLMKDAPGNARDAVRGLALDEGPISLLVQMAHNLTGEDKEYLQRPLLLPINPLQQNLHIPHVQIIVHVLAPLAVEGLVQGRGKRQHATLLVMDALAEQGQNRLHLVVGPLAVAICVPDDGRPLGGLSFGLLFHSSGYCELAVAFSARFGGLERVALDGAVGDGSSGDDAIRGLAASGMGAHVETWVSVDPFFVL